MSSFSTHETTGDEEVAVQEVEGQIREFVRRDFVANRREPESESQMVAGNIASLLQRVSGHSVQEIDRLIGELQALRETLHQEAARVQREIAGYASLSQSAMQSTKIIADTLTGWKKVPDAPSISA
jgi:cation transport regulator ChaC